MKVPFKWLQEYIKVTTSAADLANKLTIAGIESKLMQVADDKWENIVISQIVAINPHPNADRLRLPTIDLGTEQVTVVCGAPNLKVGDKIAFARVGAKLIDSQSGERRRLVSAMIRGVISHGMICSERELGISDSHEGIMILPPDALVGSPMADYLSDAIFDLDVTPNRPDCLSIIGIAREAAALTGQSVHLPETGYDEVSPSIEQQITVEITDSDLCPRYCASLITGIHIDQSPIWMQERLLACGMHPINNVVDITNYVMLEYGQPLHAFDYKKIKGKKVIIRRANDGEAIVSLDGVRRILSDDALVISDSERAVAIAGIMGGANSEVTADTTSILLESANFKPSNIHYTGRKLLLPSEACMRFERGTRPELTIPALKRATQLFSQLTGGHVAKGIIDVYPNKQDQEPILLSVEKVKRLLGVEFSFDQIKDSLTSLGFGCQATEVPLEILVTAPYWRNDINLDVDLIEEVARITGYDKITMTMLGHPLPRHNPEPILGLKWKIKESLIGLGFQEIITFSLTSWEKLRNLKPESGRVEPIPLRLANPMTADLEYLRPTLLANLLTTLVSNRRYDEGSIMLFELGRVYHPHPPDLPQELETLCVLLSGSKLENSWQGEHKPLDFFEAKGTVESLFNKMGITAIFEKSNNESLHPSRQSAILMDSTRLGFIGELHPKVSLSFDISEPVYVFEIDLTVLLPFTTSQNIFLPISRFPAITRDMSLIVDTDKKYQEIQSVIKSFPLVTRVNIFDVYTGKQVTRGKKSLACRITYLSATHTLTDEEVNQVQQQILTKLFQEFGTTLRA
ncbi:phenylalanine--tRNA ligase subunit beta [Chloroflexota bacterium]